MSASRKRRFRNVVFVLDPKGDLWRKALSVIDPAERDVDFIDFNRPGMTINPFKAEASRTEIADAIVEGLKAIHIDGAIQAASSQMLYDASMAVQGAEPDPSLWDMAKLLSPGGQTYREWVVARIQEDPELYGAARYFGLELPLQLQQASAAFTQRLAAPLNKLRALTKPDADAIVRGHRGQPNLNIDECIREGRCVVINGASGAEDMTAAVMQFVLHELHRAMMRIQLELDGREPEVRVILIADEGHRLFGDLYTRMAAMGRSAGLCLFVAWQSLSQIEDPLIRGQVLDLHKNLFVSRVGAEDARHVAPLFAPIFEDVIRSDEEARRRTRVTADALINFDKHFVCAKLSCRESPSGAFVCETTKMYEDDARIEEHLRKLEARGGVYLGPPKPPGFEDLVEEYRRKAEQTVSRENGAAAATETASTTEAAASEGAAHGAANGAPQGASAQKEAAETVQAVPGAKDGNEPKVEAGTTEEQDGSNAQAQPSADDERLRGIPDAVRSIVTHVSGHGDATTHAELGSDLPRVKHLVWLEDLDRFRDPTGIEIDEPPDAIRDPKRMRLDPRELEVLHAIYQLRFAMGTQLGRQFFPTLGPDAVGKRLSKLKAHGLVKTIRIKTKNEGRGGGAPRVLALTNRGFAYLVDNQHLTITIPEKATFQETEIKSSAGKALHDLSTAALLFSLLERAPQIVSHWRGTQTTYFAPPRMRVGRGWRTVRAEDCDCGPGRRVVGLQMQEFEPVQADLQITVELRSENPLYTADYFIERDRNGKFSFNRGKLTRYDAMITGWSLNHQRRRQLGFTPSAIWVCDDEKTVLRLCRAADDVLTGSIAMTGTPAATWQYPGRDYIWFMTERDWHQGSFRAVRVPALPPEVRRALAESGFVPRRGEVIDPDIIRKSRVLAA